MKDVVSGEVGSSLPELIIKKASTGVLDFKGVKEHSITSEHTVASSLRYVVILESCYENNKLKLISKVTFRKVFINF